MLWVFALKFVSSFLSSIFFLFPVVTSLPFGIDEALSYGFGLFYSFLEVMPPLVTVFQAFLLFLSIKFALYGLKFVLFIINLIRGSGAQL